MTLVPFVLVGQLKAGINGILLQVSVFHEMAWEQAL